MKPSDSERAAPVDPTAPVDLRVPAAAILFRIGILSMDGTGARSRSSQRLFNALLGNTTDDLLIVRMSGTITWISPRTRARRIALVGDSLVRRTHPDDRAVIERALTEPRDGAHTVRVWSGVEQRWVWVDLSAADLRDDPVVNGFVVSLHDVSNRVSHETALREIALHDPLTGLPNRSLLLDRLDAATARARRRGTRVAVLFFDLDHFKDVNDSLGHAAGDQLLCQVAERISGRVRTSDTFGRLGGDEFVILLENITAEQPELQVGRFCDELLGSLDEPFSVGTRRIGISSSIGVEICDGHCTAVELLRAADVAMYEAKSRGRRRWVRHTPQMSVTVRTDFAVRERIAEALDGGKLSVHYQPIVDLSNGDIVGHEALARLVAASGEQIPPDAFIPVAETHGRIHLVGLHVLETACRTLAALPGRISVNVSPHELRHPDYSLSVMETIARTGVAPARLVLELTESTGLDTRHHEVTRNLLELRSHGIGLAVDDFGRGFSALERLRNLPATSLKIDRSFIDGLATIGSGDLSIVRAVAAMGHALDLEVVAEGVENRLQLDILRTVGVRFGQGYLLGRPMATPRSERSLVPAGE